MDRSGGEESDPTHDIEAPLLRRHVAKRERRVVRKIKRDKSDSTTIFKVPRTVRESNPQAYNPCVLSLGPVFHSEDNKGIPENEDDKKKRVEEICTRLNVEKIEGLDQKRETDEKIECLINKLKLNDFKGYYDGVEWNKETLTRIILSADYIIQFIYNEDRTTISGIHQKVSDILKLENQIPLPVILKLLDLHTEETAESKKETVVSKFVSQIYRLIPVEGYPLSIQFKDKKELKKKIEEYIRDGVASHMLDLNRMLIRDILLASFSNSNPDSASPRTNSAPNRNDDEDDDDDDYYLPSAAELRMGGIKLHKSDDGKIRFEKHFWRSAKLFLPQIIVDDNTETLLRNLMAFEECGGCARSGDPRIISYYILLLVSLIRNVEDVALLRKRNIIQNLIGNDKDIAEMFSALDNGITAVEYGPYDEVLKSVKEYHKNRLHRSIASFKEKYCSSPWLFATFVAGALIFVMTLIQTTVSLINN